MQPVGGRANVLIALGLAQGVRSRQNSLSPVILSDADVNSPIYSFIMNDVSATLVVIQKHIVWAGTCHHGNEDGKMVYHIEHIKEVH